MITAPLALSVFLSASIIAGAASAQLQTSVVDECREVIAYVPSDDVNFVPGVDVSGNPVAPADLNGGYGIATPDEVTIDIRLDLAQRLGLGEGPASALIGGEGVIGQVTVSGNDLFWNGTLLPRDSQFALLESCGEVLSAAGVPLPTLKPAAPDE